MDPSEQPPRAPTDPLKPLLLHDRQGRMVSEAEGGGDEDVLLLVHQLPLDMDGDHVRRVAHLLPPLHTGDDALPPPPPHPFRPPPPLQVAASAEPRLSFRGWLGAPRHWDLWVAKLRPIHADLWRRLGIHDAVVASTCRFRRDASALLHLASFWCSRTNTFAFPWGEATITLHDVAVLAGFPAHGAPVPAPLPPDWRADEAALNGVRLGFNRSACKKAHHSAWVKHFLTDDHASHEREIEHAAFLALWLTRFVLPGHPESTMRQSLFPIAIRLARGERLALGPAVLASLYRDLRDIKAFLVATAAAASTGNADMLSSLSLYAPLYILQLWMWEHFPTLRPGKDNSFRDGHPMATRWHDVSRKINPTLIREALSSADTFLWQPYPCSMHTTGWVRSSGLAGNDDLKTLAHCLRPCELIGMDCIEQYLPHRVARQFGLDQDVPEDVPRANQNWAVAWQTFELEGKNVSFFIPQAEPRVTARYAHWWRQQLPHCELRDAGAPGVPVECKTSKRKVKKTLAAMEAEEEKERRLKKVRSSPVTSDKKRKVEELYDSKLSNWLTAARNKISDAAGGSYQRRSSLPKYDTALDEALLPNVGTTNDDVVLLVPRKKTTSPEVTSMNGSGINLAIQARDTLVADISNGTEGGVTTATLQEVKLMLPGNVSSPDVTGSPEEGTTVVIELEKEATGASDTPEEISAQVTEEKEEKSAIEGISCVAGTDPSMMSTAVVMEVDEGNAVSEEVGRAAEEAIEVPTQSQHEADAGAMREEALPIEHTNSGCGCTKVSCTMEDCNIAGGLSTDSKEAACRNFVVEEQREVPSVEVIREGGDHQVIEKDNEENPQEDPQTEIVESAEDTALMGSGNEGGNKTDPPTMDEVPTSDSMTATLLGVPEAENAEVVEDLNLAKKCTEDMPVGVAEGEEAELEQANTSTRGAMVEEHNEFSEVDHTDMEDQKTHSSFDTKRPGEAAGVVCAEIDGAEGAENAEVKRDLSLAKGDTEDMYVEVAGGEEADNTSAKGGADMEHNELSEVDHLEIADANMHSHTDIEKPEEADVVVCAEINVTMRLSGRDVAGEKLGVVPKVGNDEIEKVRGVILGIKDEKLAEVSEVEHTKVEAVKSIVDENTSNKSEDVPVLENAGSGETYGTIEEDTGGRLSEVHNVNAEVESSDGHVMNSDEPKCVLQDLQTRDETLGEVGSKEKLLADGNLRDEPLREGDIKEKPHSDGEGLQEKDVDVSKEAYKVKQAELEGCNVEMEEEGNINDALGVEKAGREGKRLIEEDIDIHACVEEVTLVVQVDGQNESLTTVATEEIPGQTTQAHEKELDKDFVDDSKNSTGEIPCSLSPVQLERDQMEGSRENMMEEQHIQNVELVDQMEPSSDAAMLMVEGVHENKTLDTHEEATQKQEQDQKNICDYRDKTTLEGNHIMDSGVRPALATLEVDETHAVQDQNFSDMGKQLAMEERQDGGVIVENNKMDMSKGAYIMVCDERQIYPTSIEVNEVESTKGIRGQELIDNEEQLAMKEIQDVGIIVENKMDTSNGENQLNPAGTEPNEVEFTKGMQNQEPFITYKEQVAVEERQDVGTRIENNKIYMSEDADILSCAEYQINPSGMVIDEVESTQRIHKQELLDNKVVMEERVDFITDRSGRSLEEAFNAAGGVNTFAVAVGTSDSTQNKEASNMESLSTVDKQNHGVENVNERRILEDASMAGSGELNSGATVLDVNMAGSREGTLGLCALGAKKEAVVLEKEDLGAADENTKRDLADIDVLECGGVKPEEAGNKFHETLLTEQAVNTLGFIVSSENKQKEASCGKQTITEVEGSESKQTVMKEQGEEAPAEPKNPPPEPKNAEVKQEKLENETETFIYRDNDAGSEKNHTSAEVTVTPNLEEPGENGNGLAEESTKGYVNLASKQKTTPCILKLGKSSIEDVKKTYNTRSMYLKDIKESLGRIRAEPLNRAQITGVGNHHSRHALQEPVSVCKEIKVPLRDSASDLGRERAPEETSRWRQEQYALQILEDVQNSRVAEKTRMEMEIRVLKAQIACMERQVMNLTEVKSRSKRH